MHKQELHNLYFSPRRIQMIKTKIVSSAGHIVRMEEKRSAYRILVGIPDGK
jgi:hypothetical protein